MPFTKIDKPCKPPTVAITGPTGSGKTFLSLALATLWVEDTGKRIAFLDTESGRGAYFARLFDYDYDQLLNSFEPTKYIKAIEEASKAKDEQGNPIYGAIILDSLTHAWNDTGGILDQVNRAGGNTFQQWGVIGTPEMKRLLGAIIRAPIPVFVTLRSKMDYVQEENDKGKKVIRRIGLMPEMRESAVYDFDFWMELDMDHSFKVTKCPPIDGMSNATIQPTAISEFVKQIQQWMKDGSPVNSVPATWDEMKALLIVHPEHLDVARNIYKQNTKLTVGEVWEKLQEQLKSESAKISPTA